MSQRNGEARADAQQETTAAVTPSLRPGEVVEVRSAAEILSTLDADGTIDGVPFMPEMLRFAGRRLTVSRRVEKLCDTISWTGSRRMRDTVYLEDLRCDGSGHGGCQAGCMIYWKEAWLKRVDGEPAAPDEEAERRLEHVALAGTRPTPPCEEDGRELWRCQATEAVRATDPLKTSDLRQYWRELKSGNHRLGRFLTILTRGFFWEVASRLGWITNLPLRGDGTTPPAEEPLGLEAGDLVRVRPPAEIAPTLDATGLSARLSFDREMLPFCGGTYRVRDRVERLVDDRTGRMLKISADCIILEGVVCSGERTPGSWFCPRQIYPYWRESWLRRVEEPAQAEPDGRGPSEARPIAR